jgi:hypothetical protein
VSECDREASIMRRSWPTFAPKNTFVSTLYPFRSNDLKGIRVVRGVEQVGHMPSQLYVEMSNSKAGS